MVTFAAIVPANTFVVINTILYPLLSKLYTELIDDFSMTKINYE